MSKTCFVCGHEVTEEHGCLNNGGYAEFRFGFGSKFDLISFKGFIHDECLDHNFNINLLEMHNELDNMKAKNV